MSLNDPQWGRNPNRNNERDEADGAQPENDSRENDNRPNDDENYGRDSDQGRDNGNGKKAGAGSDLDQLWDEFNRALGGLLGGSRGKQNGNVGRGSFERDYRDRETYEEPPQQPPQPPQPPRAQRWRDFGANLPNGFSAKTIVLALGVALVGWAATGIYIVPEGQVGVVTTFGRYTQDSAAGINWRMPWPIQNVEIVDVSSVRKAEIGIRGSQRLKEALMLTDDENIVDVMFNVQYRIKPHMAKEFLFRSRNPDQSVVGAAESAMREVVGRKTMDSVLFESKQEIAASVRHIMQQMLDRYDTGIEVMSVAIQNAQPPQQVQAAFNDAVKAGQDRERQINEGQAYANAVVPAARGLASRLTQEAEGYKARVVETATGDAQRFGKVLAEYERAPKVTRDRLYIDAMKDVYSNTKKVLVESRSGSNLLYLPFEKLLEQSKPAAAASQAPASGISVTNVPQTAVPQSPTVQTTIDPASRDYMRLRGR